MDQQTTTGSRSSLPSAIPWPVWLLLLGAVVQLGVQIAPDSYSVFGPYFLVDAGMVIDWIRSISPFLLGAAVVLAADRWPRGRQWLLIGAAAIGGVALLRMATDIWFAGWQASGHTWDIPQPWLAGGSIVAGVLSAVGYLLLAGGLWRAGRHRPPVGARAVLIALVGVGGLVATAAALWVAARTLAFGPTDYLAYSVVGVVLMAVGFAALAALAVAAVRVIPRAGGLPETLIAVGAVLTMAASAWAGTFPYFVPEMQTVSEEAFVWVFTLPYTVEVVGLLTMIAGFGFGALAVHRARRGGATAV